MKTKHLINQLHQLKSLAPKQNFVAGSDAFIDSLSEKTTATTHFFLSTPLVLATLVLFFFTSSAVTIAAKDSQPGDFLYPVKQNLQKIPAANLIITFNPDPTPISPLTPTATPTPTPTAETATQEASPQPFFDPTQIPELDSPTQAPESTPSSSLEKLPQPAQDALNNLPDHARDVVEGTLDKSYSPSNNSHQSDEPKTKPSQKNKVEVELDLKKPIKNIINLP